MHEVFISYAREDLTFVETLKTELETRELKVWVDLEGIYVGEDFGSRIRAAIEGADAFVFVITPDSVASPYCRRELDYAASLNKRILPALHRMPVDDASVPEAARTPQWALFNVEGGFEKAADTLAKAVKTDPAYVRAHTRLLVRAREWESKDGNTSFVLRGQDLKDAEGWLAGASEHADPRPTALHRRYITASRKAATRRMTLMLGAAVVGLVVAGVLLLAWFTQRRTNRATQLVEQGRAVYDEEPLLGLRLVLEGLAYAPSGDTTARAYALDALRSYARQGRLASWGSDVDSLYAAPDSVHFVVDHARGPGELRRPGDGFRMPLTDQLTDVDFVLDGAYFIAAYRSAPSEVRQTADGARVATLNEHGHVLDVVFSADTTLFFVKYDGMDHELRRTEDGTIVALAGRVQTVSFSSQPAISFFVAAYYDAPGELRRLPDAAVLDTLAGIVSYARFSPDPAQRYVALHFRDESQGIELRRTTDAAVVPLAGSPSRITFSRDRQGTYFVVYYADARAELHRTSDGERIALPSQAHQVRFSPDPAIRVFEVEYEASDEVRRIDDASLVARLPRPGRVIFGHDSAFFIVDYEHEEAELRRTSDGAAVPLSGTLRALIPSFPREAPYVVVAYTDAPAELRRRSDGSLVARLSSASRNLRAAFFSRDPEARYFELCASEAATGCELHRLADGAPAELRYRRDLKRSYILETDPRRLVLHSHRGTTELRRTADTTLVATLPGSEIVLRAVADTLFLVHAPYDDRPDVARRARDGAVLATLRGRNAVAEPLSETSGSYLVVTYGNGASEVWGGSAPLRRLAELGQNRQAHYFDPTSERAVITYSDGRADVLDLRWLLDVGGDPAAQPADTLVHLACNGLLAAGHLEETALQPYLGSTTPRACR